ncbi:MAG: hypothetical protein EU548_06130 [Promethearchaeota archaeon]|nr:MAG: hypothetical protein EU548_06130 [Candidatus Lokiarchaeota archaeon]
MNEKKEEDHNAKKKVHDLIIFDNYETKKDFSKSLSEKTEHIDQEYEIKLINDLEPFGDKFRYSVFIRNESLSPINEVKIMVKYPRFLNLSRSSPPTVIINTHEEEEAKGKKEPKELTLQFDQISATNTRQVNFYFNPLKSKEKGTIKTFTRFLNADDYVRVLNSDPIEVKTIPVSVEPKIVPSSYIPEFLKLAGLKKAIKSVGIVSKKEFNPDFYFDQIEVIIRMNNFQKIAKDEKKKICWYFGKHVDTNQEILIIGQVNDNKIEWIASSKNSYILVSVLTYFLDELKTRLLRMGIINSENDIYNLSCANCGHTLPKFPKKGEYIECSNCKLKQIVW